MSRWGSLRLTPINLTIKRVKFFTYIHNKLFQDIQLHKNNKTLKGEGHAKTKIIFCIIYSLAFVFDRKNLVTPCISPPDPVRKNFCFHCRRHVKEAVPEQMEISKKILAFFSVNYTCQGVYVQQKIFCM